MGENCVENGMIESTSLGWGGGAPCLTVFLHLTFDGTGQGFGGYAHDEPVRDAAGKFLRREGTAWGMEWISRVLQTLEVQTWEKLPGTIIRVRRERPGSFGGPIVAIGHAYKDRWFEPQKDLAHLLHSEVTR
jgi:hypothetical protein